MFITNGGFPDDNPGQFTFMSTQGKMVIDLIMCNAIALYITIIKVLHFSILSNNFPGAISLILDKEMLNNNNLRWKK